MNEEIKRLKEKIKRLENEINEKNEIMLHIIQNQQIVISKLIDEVYDLNQSKKTS